MKALLIVEVEYPDEVSADTARAVLKNLFEDDALLADVQRNGCMDTAQPESLDIRVYVETD